MLGSIVSCSSVKANGNLGENTGLERMKESGGDKSQGGDTPESCLDFIEGLRFRPGAAHIKGATGKRVPDSRGRVVGAEGFTASSLKSEQGHLGG